MQTIYLDISNKGVIPCIQAKQSEVGRKFLAVITDNGVPYNIPTDSLLSVWYEGNADAGNYSSIEQKSAFSINGNKVSVELVAQMLLKPGNGEMCLSISHADGGETNTWNIPYCVEYKPGAGSAVPTEYYTALTDAAALAAEQVGAARTYAEAASSDAKYIYDMQSQFVTNLTLLEKVYPIGSVYITMSTENPSSFIGGTWTLLPGRFLLGYDPDKEKSVGSVGGEETHTLTVDEIPAHTHTHPVLVGAAAYIKDTASGSDYGLNNEQTGSTGGTQPHNNMPPYIVVYMWQRTA